MIWGDIIGDPANPRMFAFEEAKSYCESLHAELPQLNDYVRLANYMGATSPNDCHYVMGGLPHLYVDPRNPSYKAPPYWNHCDTHGMAERFWAIGEDGASNVWGQFDLTDFPEVGRLSGEAAARCIVRP